MRLFRIFDDKEFYKKMIKLAFPIALQNLIFSLLNLVDTLMIGGLGKDTIAGVGIANQYFFLLNLFLFGVTSGSSIFTAQFWGNKDYSNIKKALGLSILTGTILSSLFMLGGLFFPRQILGIFSTDYNVIVIGSGYLKIVALSYVITAVSYSYSFTMRSIGKANVPMYISAFSLGLNTTLNYILINGHLGFPRLGANGAAIATNIARISELLLFILVIYGGKLVIAASIKEMLSFSFDFAKKFYKVTVPVILNEGTWALGVSLYSVAFARMGTEIIAATTIAQTVNNLTWVIFMGIGNACAIMIGNKLGEGDSSEVYVFAKRYLIIGPAFGIIIGIILYLTSDALLSIYNISPDVHEYAYRVLVVISFFLWIRIFNFIAVVGVLRSGGDTVFSLFLDIGGVWLIGVPFAFIAGLVWKLPIQWVYTLISLEEVFKMIIGSFRIRSKKWINNLATGA